MEQLTDKYGGAAEAAADKDVFGGSGWRSARSGRRSAPPRCPCWRSIVDWFGDKANIDKIQGWIGKLETWATTIGEDIRGKVQEFVDWLKSDRRQAGDRGHSPQAVEDLGDALLRRSSGGSQTSRSA